MWKVAAAILLCASAVHSANYFVRLSGSDGLDGLSIANAWQTIGKATTVAVSGDSVDIGPGDFDEYVQFTGANVRWFSNSNAITRAFRFDGPSNTLSGITLSKACDANWRTWGAFLYLDSDAHFTTVTNCKIINQPWVAVTNWSFNPASPTNTISSPDVDFIAKGFAVGGVFWVNGVSYSNTTRGAQFRFANQQRAVRPTNVTQTTLIFSNAVLTAETNPSVWAVISAGATFDFKGIVFTPSGGTGPTNCLVTGCVFSNMVGQPLLLNGNNNVISNCTFTHIFGNSMMSHGGSNHRFVRNRIYYGPLPAYYSELEVVDHTGGTFYDYYVRTIIGSDLQTHNTNFLYQGNWMEAIDGAGLGIQHASLADPGDHHTYDVIENVFVGVAGPTDGGQDNMRFISNTWYRCSFQTSYSESSVTIGGTQTYTNSGLVFTHNLMVANGDHKAHTNEGYPSFSFTTNITSFSNYVCGVEVSKWNPMPSWGATNGVNGGDPMFVNEFNPRGPDGIPFTDDDGLRLHPNSPARGIGALSVTTNLFAFFRPVNVASNFLDARGTNFNLPWHTNLFAFTRTNWDRAYDIGDALLNLPMTVRFEATNSVSGNWSTNEWYGIRDFLWTFDFGDAQRSVWVRVPDMECTFLRTGAVTITLTVTNWAGDTASHSRNYRIMPASGFTNDIIYVSTTGDDDNAGTTEATAKRTVTNGMARLGPGDYLAVLPGSYFEWCDVDPTSSGGPITNGTAELPITVVGYAASAEGARQEKSWWTWEGFEFGGDITMTTSNRDAYFHIAPLQNGITLRACYWNGAFTLTNGVSAILQQASGGAGGTNHIIEYCRIDRIIGHDQNSVVHFSGVTNLLYDGSIDTYLGGQADALKVYGANVTWSRHTSLEFGFTNNNHSDWMSFGIASTQPTSDILVDRCWAESHFGTETAMANNGNGDVWRQCTNLTVRNSVFINFMNGFNPLGFDAAKIYSCLFYRSPWTNQVTTVMGINKSSQLEDFRNNIFFENYQHGRNTNAGWYANGYLVAGGLDTNVSFVANSPDYNFVCGTNFFPKDAAPPDDYANWAVTGQEVHGINGGNPQFRDPANHDFHLNANSPLINAAVVISGGPATDFWGRDRGVAWDIGPFESAPVNVEVLTNTVRGSGRRLMR